MRRSRVGHRPGTTGLAIVAALFVLPASLLAGPGEVKYIFSRSNEAWPAQWYTEIGAWANTGTGAGAKPPGAPSGSRYTASAVVGKGCTINPTLDTPGGTYRLEYTMNNSAGNITNNCDVSITQVDCTGLPETTNKFNSNVTDRAWTLIGDFTLAPGVTTPTITFTYTAWTSGRACLDAWRITYLEPCLNTPPVGQFDGPIVPGDTSVTVTGCALSATLVKVYKLAPNPAENVLLGSAPGGTAIVEVNPLSPALAQGDRIGATQVVNDQEGCVPTYANGFPLGTANGSVRLALSVRDQAGMTGPLGAQGPTGNQLELIGANTYVSGAPQGKLLLPQGCWQTITFKATEPNADVLSATGLYALGDGVINNLPWGNLEGLSITVDADNPQTGPYTLYIDAIENGDRGRLTGFESTGEIINLNVGDEQALFSLPRQRSQTQEFMLANPNITVVTDEQAFEGTQSLKVQFQFRDLSTGNYCQLYTAPSGAAFYPSPMIDLTQPITMRVLLLTAGAAPSPKPTINAQPVDSPTCPGGAVAFTIDATVPAPDVISYQWQMSTDGGNTWSDIAGETGSSYSFTAAADESMNRYRCRVTDTTTTCYAESRPVRVIQKALVEQQPVSAYACENSSASFTVLAQVAPNLSYQWKVSTDNGSSWENIQGATGATLTIDPVPGLAAGEHYRQYKCEVISGCPPTVSDTSLPAVLYVYDNPVQISVAGQAVTGIPAMKAIAHGATNVSVAAFGYVGTYYNITAAASPPTPAPTVLPDLARLDPAINLDWGEGSPDASITIDGFITWWHGKVVAPVTDTYNFHAKTDDGQRVWVNGTLIIDHWVQQGNVEWCGPGATAPGTCTPVDLTAGQVVDVAMEFYENAGAAAAALQWSAPSLAKQPVENPVVWKKNGEVIAGQTSGLINIASFTGANAGTYTCEMVSPCTGATLLTPAVELLVSADFDGVDGVTATDVANWVLCATGPDVAYGTLTEPCNPGMDQDGDGDIDMDDFGSVQRQVGW